MQALPGHLAELRLNVYLLSLTACRDLQARCGFGDDFIYSFIYLLISDFMIFRDDFKKAHGDAPVMAQGK